MARGARRHAIAGKGDEIPMAAGRFTPPEIASGLPDGSREADESTAERQMRGRRGCGKVARAAVPSMPRRSEARARDRAQYGNVLGSVRRHGGDLLAPHLGPAGSPYPR